MLLHKSCFEEILVYFKTSRACSDRVNLRDRTEYKFIGKLPLNIFANFNFKTFILKTKVIR